MLIEEVYYDLLELNTVERIFNNHLNNKVFLHYYYFS